MTKTSQRVSSALMKGRLPVPCDQGLVKADEQWLQSMQALGHRARRQVQPQPPPGLEQPFGRPLGGELVVQDLDPDRGAQPPLGDQFGHGWRGDRPRPRTATGPLIAPPSNQPPIGLDFDLHLFRHFRATGGQGSSAGRACALQLGQYPGFFADRQMAIIAASGTGAVVPLTARLWRRGLVRVGEVIVAIGRGRRLRFASEQLILELAILAAELGDFLFQRGDLLFGHGMLTALVAGLLP